MFGQDLYPITMAALAVALAAVSLCIFLLLTAFRVRKSAEQSVQTIAASLNRMEKLFDQVFSDTFFMMRETLSYSLRQTDPGALHSAAARREPAPGDSSVPVTSTASRLQYLEKKLAELVQSRDQTGDLIAAMKQQMAAMPSANSAKRPEPAPPSGDTTRLMILEALQRLRQTEPLVRASTLLEELERKGKQASEVVRELETIQAEGIIQLSDDSPIDADTTITLT